MALGHAFKHGCVVPVALVGATMWGASQADCVRYAVDLVPGPDCTFVASSSSGTGISATGELCGGWFDCNGTGHGGVWLGQRGWQVISLPPEILGVAPADMNTSRHMAANVPGSPNPELYRAAFVDFPNGTTTVIGGLPGSNMSFANAINESSVVCGYSFNSATGVPPYQAFSWQNGRMTPLILPFGSKSVAQDIADNGSVCGWMGNGNYSTGHGFILSNGQAIDLGSVLPGAMGVDLRAINNFNSVCGIGVFADPDPRVLFRKRACLWNDGNSIDLGTLPGCMHSRAFDLNDSNVVIGYCDNYPYGGLQFNPTFVWRNGVMSDLDDLIPANLNLHIDLVWSINNVGQITGVAWVLAGPDAGDQVAVRLTPIPPEPGDSNCDDLVNIDDLLNVVNYWGATGPTPGDLNDDRIVNIDDLLILINNWG